MTISLLMIFFLYNTGWYAMYLLSKREVKQEVRSYIKAHPGEADVVLTFDLANGEVTSETFSWEDGSDEFSYQGSMYDVISTQQKDGKLIVKCIDDKKEKELKAAMAKMNRSTRSKAGFAFSPFLDKIEPLQVQAPAPLAIQYNLTKEANIKRLNLPLLVPPPDQQA